MLSREVTISNKLGLHARAAAKLVSMASGFGAEVTLEKQGQKVNGKSIMGVMMLAASRGTVITNQCQRRRRARGDPGPGGADRRQVR